MTARSRDGGFCWLGLLTLRDGGLGLLTGGMGLSNFELVNLRDGEFSFLTLRDNGVDLLTLRDGG